MGLGHTSTNFWQLRFVWSHMQLNGWEIQNMGNPFLESITSKTREFSTKTWTSCILTLCIARDLGFFSSLKEAHREKISKYHSSGLSVCRINKIYIGSQITSTVQTKRVHTTEANACETKRTAVATLSPSKLSSGSS